LPSGLEIVVDEAERNERWDQFVHRVARGHHVQSSRWAQVKAIAGWRALRLVASRQGTIVGGYQLQIRSIPVVGRIGYVAKGPVAEEDDVELVDTLLDEVDRVAAEMRLAYVKVQPANSGTAVVDRLVQRGFATSTLAAAPVATVRVDLRSPVDEIFGRLRAGTRSNVRKASRKGVTVHDDSRGVARLYPLIAATAARQRFTPYPLRYYETLWDVFRDGGFARVLIAERADEAIAGLLLVCFGDSVIYKIGGWSGERSNVHPNELLHWTAIESSCGHGFDYYDLEGIDAAVARAVASGVPVDDVGATGTTRFKLGFGGDLATFPPAYDRGYRPLGRGVVRVGPTLSRCLPLVKRMVGRVR
jgi:lipid II:glycine glycyltransferase (peptidoglycan interpeptide bridge formation enzyme)